MMKKNIMKSPLWLLLSLLLLCLGTAQAQTPAEWNQLKSDINLFLVNDMGRNGYYDQKPIAELMGNMAEVIGPECVIAAGDVHHFNGVISTQDPLWTSNYENIYRHPELMIDWFPVLGNHEYRGNTQAVLDYTRVSRRWMMPARYYTRTFKSKKASVRVVFIDTTPLIDSYRQKLDKYPDACKQDIDKELAWIDTTLRNAHEDWVIVVGHHPIYAQTTKGENERLDMQRRLLSVLHKYHNVDIYACGHIHNFQHIRMAGDDIDYVVNSAGALSRPVSAIKGTVYCSSEDGFSVIAADKKTLRLYMIDKQGRCLHTVERTR